MSWDGLEFSDVGRWSGSEGFSLRAKDFWMAGAGFWWRLKPCSISVER